MMGWMPVNDILRDEITKLNYTLVPPGFRGDARTIRVMQDSLSKVIDHLGEMSSKAQGLTKVITTAEKMQNSPSHTLYMLKDLNDNNEIAVIGFLKVGHKKLFLYDRRAQVLETEPLCILDFFVVRELQRHGHGKRLFDHMLKDQGLSVTQLAIDGPSEKMCKFLTTNYGVKELVRQANNFAVAPEFFQRDAEDIRADTGRSTPAISPGAVGRYSALKPPSSIGMVIHGGEQHLQPDTITVSQNGVSPHQSPRRPESPVMAPEPVPEPDQEAPLDEFPPSRPSTLQIDVAPSRDPLPSHDHLTSGTMTPGAGAVTQRRDSQVTDQGYFDIKFYHNKLW